MSSTALGIVRAFPQVTVSAYMSHGGLGLVLALGPADPLNYCPAAVLSQCLFHLAFPHFWCVLCPFYSNWFDCICTSFLLQARKQLLNHDMQTY